MHRHAARILGTGSYVPSRVVPNDETTWHRSAEWLRPGVATVFETLAAYGRTHANDSVTFDYFAVSLPDFLVFDDDLTLRNRIHCDYMLGLGLLGLGQATAAAAQFERVLDADASHQGAQHHLVFCQAHAPVGLGRFF